METTTQQQQRYMTTRQLARLWMVSEATVKRWADAGMLKTSRTAGGHRRFLLDEVARFQTERGIGRAAVAAPARALAGGVAGPRRRVGASRRFFEAVGQGLDEEAASLVLEAYLDGVEMWRLFDETVAVALHRVGDLWHEGGVTVADEHFATRTAARAVERVGMSVRRREGSGLRAICCAPEGELHDVPVLCLQVLLESEGWRVRNLGANTPFFTLADAVARHRPDLVCVSSTMMLDLERHAREYAQLAESATASGALVALGGGSFRDGEVRARFPADLHAASFKELVRFIKGRVGRARGQGVSQPTA